MIIVADSGATKVDWRLVKSDGSVKDISTTGLSPVFMSEEEIVDVVSTHISKSANEYVKDIFFYGAGVVGDSQREKLNNCFLKIFPDTRLQVESDMLAASRALCGYESGIACILGTGSNSCYYDGQTIIKNVKAGGFILGDEASGAYFGRRLVSDFVKGLLPIAIEKEFVRRYGLDYPTIVQKVYREEQPSKFLAGFAPFINEFSNHPYFNAMIRSGFEEFLMRNVAQYDYRRLPVNFVGSIAYNFRDILERAVSNCNMRMGKILKSPIDELVKYHSSSGRQGINVAIDKSIRSIMVETGITEYGRAKDLLMKYGSIKKAVENYRHNV